MSPCLVLSKIRKGYKKNYVLALINGVFKYLDDEFAEDRYVKKLPKTEGIKLRECSVNRGFYINTQASQYTVCPRRITFRVSNWCY
jgi:hypothetical protein